MVSVLIPVYNEAEILAQTIDKLISYMDGLGQDYELIVCDNGSTDSTASLANSISELRQGKVVFLSVPKKGVGSAFKHMVENARYEKLVSVDADLTTDISFIGNAIGLLDRYGMVIGSKLMGEQKRSFFRIFLSKGYVSLVRLLFGLSFADYSIGAKAYRKSMIMDEVKKIDKGSSYVLEMAYHLGKEKIIEIPVICDDTRPSKFNMIHEVAYRFIKLISFKKRLLLF